MHQCLQSAKSRRSRKETHRLLSGSRRLLSPNSLNGSLPVADKINTDDCTRCVFDRLIAADIGRPKPARCRSMHCPLWRASQRSASLRTPKIKFPIPQPRSTKANPAFPHTVAKLLHQKRFLQTPLSARLQKGRKKPRWTRSEQSRHFVPAIVGPNANENPQAYLACLLWGLCRKTGQALLPRATRK